MPGALVCLALAALILLALPARAGQAPVPSLPVVSATRLAGDEARTRFVADLSQAVSFNVYVLPDPYRVVLDLPEVDFELPPGIGDIGRGLVTAYRFGLMEKGRSRVVMDLSGPVLIGHSFALNPRDGQPARLVVDLVATDPRTFARMHNQEAKERVAVSTPPVDEGEEPVELAPNGASPSMAAPKAEIPVAGEPKAAAPKIEDRIAALPPREARADTEVRDGPESKNQDRVAPEPASESPAASAPEAEADPMPAPRAGSRVPLPRPKPGRAPARVAQAPAAAIEMTTKPRPENAKRVIVIDPGHGGIDPGATSKKGTVEKTVALAFAKVLKSKLGAAGYEAVLTRDSDVFLSLRDRVHIARKHNADLFMAIHADALRGRIRGSTVYTLSETGSDQEADALAHKENRSDIIGGVDLRTESEEITGILIDLAQRETKNHSVYFGKSVIQEMKPVTRLTSRPMRSANFRVLKAPDVPSILIELGYLSDRQDEALLISPEWQSKVAAAIAKAVDSYFKTRLAAGG